MVLLFDHFFQQIWTLISSTKIERVYYYLHSQAVAPLNPSVKSSVGAYRRAIGDALERDGAPLPLAHPAAAFQVSKAPAIRSGGRQAYVQRFDEQYGDVLAIARVDPRAKIELA